MLTNEQLDAAYAAFAAFIGDASLTPQALAVIQRAFLCGYAAGHDDATPNATTRHCSSSSHAGHLLPHRAGHLPVAAQLNRITLRWGA